MRSKATWFLLMLLMAVAPVPGLAGEEAGNAQAEPDVDIEHHIEEARRQLDEAARKLAELQTRMWQMETTGPRAERPMLGILLQDAGTDSGLPLAGVTPDGGAERAGLKAGDVIVEINGVRLDGGGAGRKPIKGLQEALAAVKAGDAIAVSYVRDGITGQVELVTQARGHYVANVMANNAEWVEAIRSMTDLGDLDVLGDLQELGSLAQMGDAGTMAEIKRVPAGLRLEDIGGELAGYFGVKSGVLVLDPGEAAPDLKSGDLLMSVAGKSLSDSLAALEAVAELHGRVPVEVRRHDRVRKIEFDVDALNADQAVHLVRGDRRIRIRRADDPDHGVEVIISRN